jgi:hypothetical protein
MQPTETMQRVEGKCNGKTRKGTLCKRSAGAGTKHLGTGSCSKHGGCTRNHETKGARDLATAFVVGQLGAQVAIDPLDAAVKAVELAHGSVEYWRSLILEAIEAGGEPTLIQTDGYRLALNDLSRMTDAANRAGVADRLATMDERFIEQVTLAFEETMQELAREIKVAAAQRALFVKRFGDRLRPLEGRELARAADSS